MADRRFHDRFEKSNTGVGHRLRKKIQADIDQRKFDEGKPLCFTLYHCYSILLIPLDKYPDEFRNLYSDAIFDLDMKDDLERAKVMNWCTSIKPLYPIKTTADGNCLANAVSQAMWGIEDTDAFLRRLLYVTMTTDPRGRFKRRWLIQQRAMTEEVALGLRLNTEQYNTEWDAVIRATTDITNAENQGMPYTFLESIHLYIITNILRRPIILLSDNRARNLLGESMQENDIGGIYLPLEWNHGECQKTPIVVGYNMNHFAPLLGQEDVKNGNTVKSHFCPLVTHELQSLKIHYLLPDEEHNANHLLMRYLKIEEVADGGMNVICARLAYSSLPDDLNIIQKHRKDCEKKFRNQIDDEVGLRIQPVQINNPENVPPFEFQIMSRDKHTGIKTERKPATVNAAQHMQVTTVRHKKPKRCSVVGCKMHGTPEFNGLCSKCFKDFTVQYAEDEAASRQRNGSTRGNKIPPAPNPGPIYNDLSIMGENCLTGCGFRCSTETYPYCHECYPKYANKPRVAEVRPITEDTELSLMPDKCREPNCPYRASRQTLPYCHQCYEIHVPKARPTAPLVSVPQENMEVTHQVEETRTEPNLQLRIEEEPETNVMEIRNVAGLGIHPVEIRETAGPGSYPEPINATRRENHMGMKISLAGASGTLDRKCKTGGCLNNAIRGNDGYCDKCYDQSLFGEGNFDLKPEVKSAAICRMANCSEPIASGCDLCLACFLKAGELPPPQIRLDENQLYNPHVQSSAEGRQQLVSVPKESRTAEEAKFVPSDRSAENQQSTHRKYICAKAGCDGIRIDNRTGLCYDCTKLANQNIGHRQQEPNDLNRQCNLNESTPFVSDTPFILSDEEKKEMYPLVTSSKQKVKCAAAICNNMVYPPNKLCEDCTAAIEKSFAEKQKLGESRHTAPIVSTRAKQTVAPQRHTVPIARHRPKLCIEKDCERFGDPAQKDRCSMHYNMAMQRFRQPSPPGGHLPVRNQLSDEIPNYNITPARSTGRNFPMNVPIPKAPVENGDKLTAAMYKIENDRKSRNKCRNSNRTGCNNYGNPAKQGFCNQCFGGNTVQALLGHHPQLPGLNQFD